MRPLKAALAIVGAIIGFVLLMALWSLAGSLVTSPDSIAVFAGIAIYAAVIGGIVFFGYRFINWLRKKFG